MSSRYKYPRTPHLPWSPGASEDDIQLDITSQFHNREVIITEKMDGENTTLYRDYIHARSIDSRHHKSRNWVKQLQGNVGFLIPEGWRICGENLFAKHSLYYENLQSYFYVFSIWDEHNNCLSWDDTKIWCSKLGLNLVPVIYQGLWQESQVKGLQLDSTKQEGYVVRLAISFTYSDFKRSVAKWVRANHVQSEKHWMHQEVVPNQLISEGAD